MCAHTLYNANMDGWLLHEQQQSMGQRELWPSIGTRMESRWDAEGKQ
jgi:hypothetical protein